jgi:UDP-N-acetylmuramoyl-L-alanyl-D-glutamate--2,6-diaminopimelate ligase
MARKLSRILDELPFYQLYGSLDLDISRVVYDSRRACPASLFVAVPGYKHDGIDFIPEAIARGAVAVVVEQPLPKFRQITQIVVPDARKALALVSWSCAGHPEKRLHLSGITGTNGKTTIAHLLRAMLEAGGRTAGLIGTLTYEFAGRMHAAIRTTPEAPDLADLFIEMHKADVTHCVMEVTSHALALHRVDGLDFGVAAFSNVSRDHLDFHQTIDNYRNAKALLFENLDSTAIAVINIDDDFGRELCARTPAEVLRCSLSEETDIHVTNLDISRDGISLELTLPRESWTLHSSLIGRFNASNVLMAAACGYASGLTEREVQAGLDKISDVPGRMEMIRGTQPFTVVVDFAHTPAALENVLQALRALEPERILVLVGAGGDRDPGKRAEMGRVVSQNADEIFLTSDNPRTEDPESILDALEAGLVPGAPHRRDADRRASIRRILQTARPKDMVLIAGKGAETMQEIGTARYPFDDREVARAILREMGYEA